MRTDGVKDVDFKCQLYEKFAESWRKCRIVAEGSESVKYAASEFLPILADQSTEEYTKYKNRALFFEGTTRTVNGLLGMLFAKEPIVTEGTEKLDDLIRFFPMISSSKAFLKEVAREVVSIGRTGLLVDVNSAGNPFVSIYRAEDIINWRTEEINGKITLSLLVLREAQVVLENEFKTKEVENYRVLKLDENGVYTQTLYQRENSNQNEFFIVDGYPITPTKKGVTMDSIPFFFIGPNGNAPDPVRPPLIGLANVNLSHYMNSADLEHGRHFTGLPTPWVAGFSLDTNQKLSLGSQSAWVSSKPDARAGFLEFTGQGLKSLENALMEKQEMMVVLGARLLEAPKKTSESADNQASRKHGENSILSNIADSLSEGISKALEVAISWEKGGSGSEFKLEIHKDFSQLSVDPQLIASFMTAVQGGLMSFDTWFYNLKIRGVVPEGLTLDDEKNLIDSRSQEFVTPALPQGQVPPANER